MNINKVVAYARARDTKQTEDSILKFVQSRLIAVLGPCGQGKPNERNVTRFYFDTFRGISIPILPYIGSVPVEERDLFQGNDVKTNTISKFFELGNAYFKIEDFTMNETFQEDFLNIVVELLSLCGGGIIKYMDIHNGEQEIKIVPGIIVSEEDKKNSIALTNRMLNSDVFEESEKEQAIQIGFDGCAIGYFPGLANGFLANRCVVVEEFNKDTYMNLRILSCFVNTNYCNKYSNPYKRVTFIGSRLNALTFIKYIVQIRKMEVNPANIYNIYVQEKENFTTWLKEMGYDVSKNTKGIEDLLIKG